MKKSLRVVLLTPDITRGGGGVAEVVRLLAHGLVGFGGIDVEVVTLDSPHLAEDLRAWPEIPIQSFRSYGPRSYGFSPGMLWYLARRRADLVHVHGIWMFHVFAASVWRWFWRGAVVVTPHGMLEAWILTRSRRLKRMVSTLYQTRLLRKAEAIQVLTTKEAEDVRLAVGAVRSVCIPNFLPEVVDPRPFRPVWWEPRMEGRRIFLFLGRIHEKKGWRSLCAAWDAECRQNSIFRDKAFLIFCGWLDGSDDFLPIIHQLQDSHGNVLFAGPQYGGEKAASLRAASIFLLPSASEGLPMVVLEAWSAGVPVVMTRACNLDAGFDFGAAIEAEPSVEGIRRSLHQVAVTSDADLRAMGQKGQALVKQQFSETAIMQDIVALYRKVVR